MRRTGLRKGGHRRLTLITAVITSSNPDSFALDVVGLRGAVFAESAADGVARDQELFVGRDYESMQTGIRRADLSF